MANYYANARSNYFRVKDLEAFKKELEILPDLRIHESKDKVCILFDEGISNEYWKEDLSNPTDDYVEIEWENIFKKHLEENQVAVFMESGAEKLRYVVGIATAYSWTGETVQISLDDIYGLAQEEFGGDAQISLATY